MSSPIRAAHLSPPHAARDLRAARGHRPHARVLPRPLRDCARVPRASRSHAVAALFRQHPDLIIAASGSSRHAGLAAEILLEDLAGLVVDVEYASEYACRSYTCAAIPTIPARSSCSRSRARRPTRSLPCAKPTRRGHPTIAVTNVHGSTMAREATVDLATLAGVELAIPATKSFTTQLALIVMLALLAARERGRCPPRNRGATCTRWRGVPTAIAAQLPAWERPSPRSRRSMRTRAHSSTSAAASTTPSPAKAR